MSGDLVHNIFYQYDGEECAQRIKDVCAGKRYQVKFNLYKLQNANFTNIPNCSGVSILLLTPELCDFIRSGRHPDLNVLFPNPDFSIAILFHVKKTKDEIASFLSSRVRNIPKWTILEIGADSSFSPIVIDIMDVIEKLEQKCKSDPILQKVRVWTRESVKPHQQVILIFTEPVDDDAQVKVIQEWNGLAATAERLNPMTYSFSLGDSESNLELPTLLHFGAKYGFRFFCSELLKLPGGKHALKMKNKDGLLPRQIAQNEGFDHLHLILQKHGMEDLYATPKKNFGFKDQVVIQKSQTPPAGGNRTLALNEIRPLLIMKQTSSTLSNVTDRPRFYSGSSIEEERTQELLRLTRKMTKVTSARGDEELNTRKRNNSLPELPGLGRIMRKERHYEELD